jgi:hypothetical protein
MLGVSSRKMREKAPCREEDLGKHLRCSGCAAPLRSALFGFVFGFLKPQLFTVTFPPKFAFADAVCPGPTTIPAWPSGVPLAPFDGTSRCHFTRERSAVDISPAL